MSDKLRFNTIAIATAGIVAVPVFTVPAHAYIDPGTASIVLQSIIGGIAAAGLFFRTHIMSLYYKIMPGAGKPQTSAKADEKAEDAG